jgi:signal transduction histidine kinase
LTVTVTDDGAGIPDEPIRRSGLANLAERAARWNGTLSVRRTGERGNTLAWIAALPAAMESER